MKWISASHEWQYHSIIIIIIIISELAGRMTVIIIGFMLDGPPQQKCQALQILESCDRVTKQWTKL